MGQCLDSICHYCQCPAFVLCKSCAHPHDAFAYPRKYAFDPKFEEFEATVAPYSMLTGNNGLDLVLLV